MPAWLKVVCGCFAVLVLAAIVAVWGLWKFSDAPPGLAIWVDGAATVAVGDEFDLHVRTANSHVGHPLTISSLRLEDEYLDGFMVVEVEPKASSTMQVPIDDSRSFSFDRTVAGGDTADFRFRFRAVVPGVHRGYVHVCKGVRCRSTVLETQVVDELSRPELPPAAAEPVEEGAELEHADDR